MALLPRLTNSFGPTRHELGPFLNLFNDTFSELQKLSDTASRTFAPKFDVREAEDKYFLEGELPGIAQKDIAIEFLDDQTLTIKGRTEHYRKEGPSPEEAQTSNTTSSAPTEESTTTNSKQLTAGGAQEGPKSDAKHTYWITERSVGEFARSFAFPSRVDQDNVKASLRDGILSVVVPKLQRSKETRKIQIE
jgi:HSP20 family protein